MSKELLRLGLQFFAGETKEEEDKVIIPGEEGVPGAIGVTGSTPPAYTVPENLVSAPKAQDFDTWYKANGGMDEAGYYAKYDLDPERDYQNTVNTLNYEYQTSMATYGENAEKMYQMGLQNSGVSDIFQANAFSAYLGNMNQAAADRITARRKNKAAFNDYVAGMRAQHGQYETGIKTEYDTKLNSALTYALSKYNGYNLQDVLNQLAVSGYYTDIVDEIGKRLSGMDATSLQATTETVLAQDIINNISGFTGSDADKAAAKSMFGGMFSDDVIEAAFGRAQAIYQNSAEGQDQMVEDLVTSGQASFDPNYEGGMDTFIKNVWGIETDRNAVDAEGKSLFDENAYNRAVKAWEQMKVQWDSDVGTAESFIFKNYAQGEEWINAQLSGQFSESVINKAWENFLLSNEGKQWQGTLSQASVDELVNTWTESFDPNMSKEEFVTKMITGEDGKPNEDLRANAEAAWEQMNSAYLKRRDELDTWVSENFWDESGNNTWDGSELSKATLKEMLGTTVTEKEYEYIVDKLNTRMQNLIEGAKKTAGENAENEIKTVNDNLTTIGNDKGYLTIKDYFDAYDQYGAIGENYGNEFSQPDMDEIDNIVNGIIRDALSGTTSDLASIDTANTLEGIISKDDIANWKTMSNDQRRRAVLNGAISSGRFTASERNEIVSTYVTKKVQEIVDTDNSNAKASGLADAGELVNYINSLGLNKQERQKAMESIRRGMSFRIEGDQINWYGAVEGAEATIKKNNYVNGIVTNDSVIKELNKNTNPDVNFAVYDNKLYQKSGESWYEIKPDELQVIGDGHTNTTEQAKGIYDLLVYMIELKNKLATDSGYIEGEHPTSTTVTVGGSSENGGTKGKGDTQGGRTGDFAVANK